MALTDTIPAGRRDQTITWKSPPTTRDSFGGTAKSNSKTNYDDWTTFATVKAFISTDRGRELTEGQRNISETYRRVRINYDPVTMPDETMVCLHRDRKYDVQYIDPINEANRTVDVIVREIK